jgi:hypothetical protein
MSYRKVTINNFTEEESLSQVMDAVKDILWEAGANCTASMEDCGGQGLFCFAKFDDEHIEVDVFDYKGAPKYLH